VNFRARDPRILDWTILHSNGARPRVSPDGAWLVYDRREPDGRTQVYCSRTDGTDEVPITPGLPGLPGVVAGAQTSCGNARFHPGGRFIVFQAAEYPHFLFDQPLIEDPGIGLYASFWAYDLETAAVTRLTTTAPIKQLPFDGLPSLGVANVHFSADGARMIFSARWEESPNLGAPDFKFGRWYVAQADVIADGRRLALDNVRPLFVPSDPAANYVTYMGAFANGDLLIAGNLDGQHEYGMDLYRTGAAGQVNLTNTSEKWEEDATILPSGTVVFMSDEASPYTLDRTQNWAFQPNVRDYWIATPTGKKRLTWFNDPSAPEYRGRRVRVAAVEAAPDGRTLYGTLVDDLSQEPEQARPVLRVLRIRLRDRL
jgi:hypothetical protein